MQVKRASRCVVNDARALQQINETSVLPFSIWRIIMLICLISVDCESTFETALIFNKLSVMISGHC